MGRLFCIEMVSLLINRTIDCSKVGGQGLATAVRATNFSLIGNPSRSSGSRSTRSNLNSPIRSSVCTRSTIVQFDLVVGRPCFSSFDEHGLTSGNRTGVIKIGRSRHRIANQGKVTCSIPFSKERILQLHVGSC